MTTKGYVNDFYRQFEELNKKLDKANNTISELSLTIYNLNLENQKHQETEEKYMLIFKLFTSKNQEFRKIKVAKLDKLG